MSKPKNKPLTKLLGPLFLKLSETNRKQVFMLFYYFGAIWAPPNGPKDLQVSETFGPIAKLKNKPLTKIFVLGKIVRNNQKTVFYPFFFYIWGPFGPN
jgi:hypothetical protein